jgi:hypothetical protein
LRPGPASGGFNGDGFTLTDAGREWVKNYDRESSFPLDPGRFMKIISVYEARFGRGFTQRSSEAAACYRTGNDLACCAMAGAASESILLALHIKKFGDRAKTLKTYNGREGRRGLIRDLVKGQKPRIISGIEAATGLLSYWRDDAAHGAASTISEFQSHDAVSRLLRFAQFASDDWEEITARTA